MDSIRAFLWWTSCTVIYIKISGACKRTNTCLFINRDEKAPTLSLEENINMFSQAEEKKQIDIELAVVNKKFRGELSQAEGKKIQIYNKALNGEWKKQNFIKPTKREMAEYALYGWAPDKDFRDEMLASMNQYDLTDAFMKCPIPTLIIEGKYDLNWGTDKVEKFSKHHPGSELVVLGKSSHFPFISEQDKFFKTIKQFVEGIHNVPLSELQKWEKEIPQYRENPAIENKKNNKIKMDVKCASQYDVGFFVASHLSLPGVAICLYDKKYIAETDKVAKEIGVDNSRLTKEAPVLSKELTKYWKVHRFVRVPIYFDNFKDTETAYRILFGEEKISLDNIKVFKILNDNILKLYPYLNKFTGKEKAVAKKLVALIEYEYYHFYQKYYEKNNSKFQKEANEFKVAWQKEYEPVLRKLNSSSHAIDKVEIILSPALQVHGKSFRVINGVGRVATLLPKNSEELQRGLINAYHEMCHGFSDKIVYKEMNLQKDKMSFKGSDKGSEIHSLIENAANQTMYIGLKSVNPELLDYFFNKTTYGDLSWMIKYDAFDSSINLARRNLNKKEILKLKTQMEEDPIETSKYIYERGLLVNPKVLIQINKLVKGE